jgi:uncharacterized iron-regulated membrane protein
MKWLMLLHRWAGGVIGLLLGLMGLTGAILSVRNWWVTAPGAWDVRAQSLDELVRVSAAHLNGTGTSHAAGIIFAPDGFGLHQLRFTKEAGAYVNHDGQIVARWQGIWDRPELWLFDFHHHLFAAKPGTTAVGILGLIGLGFVITGAILWWRTRSTFEWRIWPRRMTRPAIVRHHRDIGIIVAPVLFLTCLTGAMLAIQPFAKLVLSPFSSEAAMEAATEPPKGTFGAVGPQTDVGVILRQAAARFPDAEFRILSMPRKPGDPISLRLKQPEEWLPNGRTLLWFDPADNRLIDARDANRYPTGLKLFNMAYPLHAGKVGGMVWQLVIMVTGLALAMLGFLAVWSFWFKAGRRAPVY